MRNYPLAESIGVAVQEARRKKGLTISLLAKRSGYSKSMLSQLERGKSNISISGFLKLSKILNFDIDEALSLNPWVVCHHCIGSGRVRK